MLVYYLFSDVLADKDHGQVVAKDLYGCRNGGWVAHAFTDDTLNGELNSDLHWALCVTCGAW